MMHQASVSVREIAQFVGKTTATTGAIPLAPLHYRAQVLPLNYSQEEISNKYDTLLPLNPASKKDLEWWIALTTAPMGALICPPEPSVTVQSDASKQGWGAVLNGQSHTVGMVFQGGNPPYQLPGIASCFSGSQSIREDLSERNGLTANGQHHSSESYQPEGRHGIQGLVPTSNRDPDLVCREKHHPPSRTPPRPTEFTGRQGVQNSEGSLRLEAEPVGIPTKTGGIGPVRCGPICILPDKAARGGGDSCLHAELGNMSRVHQPSMVSDTSLPCQSEEAGGKESADYTIVEKPIMVPSSTGASRGSSLEDSLAARSSINATGARILMQQGVP